MQPSAIKLFIAGSNLSFTKIKFLSSFSKQNGYFTVHRTIYVKKERAIKRNWKQSRFIARFI